MADPPPAPVRYRGRPIEVRPGETLLAALARRGIPVLQRSIRYHRPRAPFCGVGFCSQCLVRVSGVPNVRACRYRPVPGDRIETENAWPSPSLDLLGLLDHLYPGGIDTLRGFRRPRFLRPLYQRVVRRLAGYGRIADRPEPPAPPAEELETDNLVVGAGPAGRAVAGRLVSAGARVALLDRREITAPPEGVIVRAEVTAAFLPPPAPSGPRRFRLLASVDGRGLLVRADRVVVATGAYDGSLLFTGSDRPGVMTAEGALALRDARGDPPFHRAVVVGGGRRAEEILDRFGARLAAVVAPGAVHGAIAERAAELELAVHPRTILLRADGRSRVRRVLLQKRGGGPSFSIPADAVVLAHRRLPNGQLLFQAGVRMHWRGGGGGYYPALEESMATSVPGLYAAGEVAGFSDAVAIEASAIAAAEAALGRTARLSELPPRVAPDGPNELEGYYRELLGRGIRGKLVVCSCEDVLLTELAEAHARGYRGIEVVKRYTALGTGLCQGRYCVPEALLVLSGWEARSPAEVGYLTQRPPVVPTALSALAGVPEPPEAEP